MYNVYVTLFFKITGIILKGLKKISTIIFMVLEMVEEGDILLNHRNFIHRIIQGIYSYSYYIVDIPF